MNTEFLPGDYVRLNGSGSVHFGLLLAVEHDSFYSKELVYVLWDDGGLSKSLSSVVINLVSRTKRRSLPETS